MIIMHMWEIGGGGGIVGINVGDGVVLLTKLMRIELNNRE